MAANRTSGGRPTLAVIGPRAPGGWSWSQGWALFMKMSASGLNQPGSSGVRTRSPTRSGRVPTCTYNGVPQSPRKTRMSNATLAGTDVPARGSSRNQEGTLSAATEATLHAPLPPQPRAGRRSSGRDPYVIRFEDRTRAKVVLASRRVPSCPRPRVSRRDWPCEMSERRVELRLAAILALDVAGYSRFVAHNSSPRLRGSSHDLRAGLNAPAVRRHLLQHNHGITDIYRQAKAHQSK